MRDRKRRESQVAPALGSAQAMGNMFQATQAMMQSMLGGLPSQAVLARPCMSFARRTSARGWCNRPWPLLRP
eukprot:14273639-Alexandrium_andersonii.AAC.1